MGLAIDGFDQKKTELPHIRRRPKDIDGLQYIHVHVVGCLIFSKTTTPYVFVNYPNIPNDGNLTIHVIQEVIRTWDGPLPKNLYVQLDNTSRENRNKLVIAYLNMLVEKDVFKKVKLGFLLVGHTHDQIEQMFSRFSVGLNGKDVKTTRDMCTVFQRKYLPTPTIFMVKQVADFRRFLWPEGEDAATSATAPELRDHCFMH